MKGFEPSDNFVTKVMEDVWSYERTQEAIPPLSVRLLGWRPARMVLSTAGVLLGAWNIIRLYMSLLAPVVCR